MSIGDIKVRKIIIKKNNSNTNLTTIKLEGYKNKHNCYIAENKEY